MFGIGDDEIMRAHRLDSLGHILVTVGQLAQQFGTRLIVKRSAVLAAAAADAHQLAAAAYALGRKHERDGEPMPADFAAAADVDEHQGDEHQGAAAVDVDEHQGDELPDVDEHQGAAAVREDPDGKAWYAAAVDVPRGAAADGRRRASAAEWGAA